MKAFSDGDDTFNAGNERIGNGCSYTIKLLGTHSYMYLVASKPILLCTACILSSLGMAHLLTQHSKTVPKSNKSPRENVLCSGSQAHGSSLAVIACAQTQT